MGGFSLLHWLVLGVVLLLLFGGNRFSAMMGDVAKGLKGFKQGLADEPTEPSRPIGLSARTAADQADGKREAPSVAPVPVPGDIDGRR
jgi:sec-independent protein translocase protein TatA